MTNINTNTNKDIFETLLLKEHELAYIEKKQAEVYLDQMAQEFKDHEENSTIITKIKDYFNDKIEYIKIKKMIYKNNKKIAKLKENEKCNAEIEHEVYKHKEFKNHIFLEKSYNERLLIANCGVFECPIIQYNVYLRIEYIEGEVWTGKHLEKYFNSYEDALKYFLELKRDYKNKNGKTILNYLTEKTDERCAELKKTISSSDNI